MVVANDVTRDSRVLREAAALASAGHRVTVLGILTANTSAPPIELRDGFVIRRLPFRARPPRWWVPPDFYARIQYRADRQYRIHRSRLRRIRYHARRAWRLLDAEVRGIDRPELLRARSIGLWRPTRPSDRFVRRFTGTVRRAFHTPLRTWPVKTTGIVRRSFEGTVPSVRGSGAMRFTRRAGVALESAGRNVARQANLLGGAVTRGIRAWGAIMSLLVWGSIYLLANRLSNGAVEWQTGWRWRWFGWSRYLLEHAPDADVWHGHDMTSLPAIIALKRARGGIAVYDSHEIYFESGRHAPQPAWAKRPLERLERRLASEADAVITVNRSVAGILAQRLNRSDVEVLYNCPTRPVGSLRGSPVRRAIGVDRTTPVLLYHGSLAPHRGVEELLTAISRPELERAHLVFLGFGSLKDWLRLEARRPRYRGRVHVLDAVPPEELPRWLAGVDVSVAPIQASTLNHRNSSPNKVFEAIAAGVPVAGSDFPEFRRVIADPEYGPLGTLFDPASPMEIAFAIRQLLDLPPASRTALRRRCRRAAMERWNWETESRALLRLYASMGSAASVEPSVAARVGAA